MTYSRTAHTGDDVGYYEFDQRFGGGEVPPSRPVFTFPVHWPELGVDLGMNYEYCHPLLTTTGPNWVWDLGLDHRHQPLPGSLIHSDEANLSIRA